MTTDYYCITDDEYDYYSSSSNSRSGIATLVVATVINFLYDINAEVTKTTTVTLTLSSAQV